MYIIFICFNKLAKNVLIMNLATIHDAYMVEAINLSCTNLFVNYVELEIWTFDIQSMEDEPLWSACVVTRLIWYICPSFHQILAPNTPSGLTILNGIFNRYHYSLCLKAYMYDDRSCNATCSQGYWDGGGVMWSKQPPTPPPPQTKQKTTTNKPQTKNKTKTNKTTKTKQNTQNKTKTNKTKQKSWRNKNSTNMYVDSLHLTAYMCIHGFFNFFFLGGVKK